MLTSKRAGVLEGVEGDMLPQTVLGAKPDVLGLIDLPTAAPIVAEQC